MTEQLGEGPILMSQARSGQPVERGAYTMATKSPKCPQLDKASISLRAQTTW